MRVYRDTYRDRDTGKLRKARRFTVEFRDHQDALRKLTLYADERASNEAGRRIERLVALRNARSEPDADTLQWIADCDSSLRDRLIALGLLDPVKFSGSRPLTEHLTAWASAMGSKGDTAAHVEKEHGRAKRLLVDLCGFQTYQDIDPEAVRGNVGTIKVPGKDPENPPEAISPATRNKYLRAVKGFCRWMVDEGRALRNPLSCLKAANRKAVESVVRHARRALTGDELCRLLKAATEGPTLKGTSGPERALAYRLALETGLRAGELHGLTKANFRLDGTPAVILQGSETKNGKGATLPLKPETAALLQEHLRDRLPMARAFNLPRKDIMVDLLKADLGKAGIVYNLHGRFADWHALRHTFITNLANSGIHPKVAQDLARHSDINLTLSRYSHTVMEQRAEAVNRLPDLDTMTAAAGVREATNDAPISGPNPLHEHRAGHRANGNPLPVNASRGTHNPQVAGPNPAGPTTSNTAFPYEKSTIVHGAEKSAESGKSTPEHRAEHRADRTAGAETTVADLQRAVESCRDLPAHIRQTILTLLTAAGATGGPKA